MDLSETNVRDFYPDESKGKFNIYTFSVKHGDFRPGIVNGITKDTRLSGEEPA